MVEVVPDTRGKQELVGEGETKMSENFTCMWGLEGFPTFVDQCKVRDVVDQDRVRPGRRVA